jgi:hypothetical protein
MADIATPSKPSVDGTTKTEPETIGESVHNDSATTTTTTTATPTVAVTTTTVAEAKSSTTSKAATHQYGLRPCGCHRKYPPHVPSEEYNATMRNRLIVAGLSTIHWFTEGRTTNYGTDGVYWRPPAGMRNRWMKLCSSRQGLAEASTMRWVTEQTNGRVPVPKVIAAVADSDKSFIIMEPARGRRGGRYRWLDRSAESKANLYRNPRSIIDELRSIPPPPGTRFSTIDRGPLFGGLEDYSSEPVPRLIGPTDTVAQLWHQRYRDMYHDKPYDAAAMDATPPDQDFSLTPPPPDCPPVFSHGTFWLKNVFLDENDNITDVIGWEGAGWWPEWYEYIRSRTCDARIPDDYVENLDKFLTPYPEALKLELNRMFNYHGF